MAWKQYSEEILQRKIIANKYLIKIVEKLDREYREEQHKAEFPYYFDDSVLEKILTIVGEMSHVKGDMAGQKIVLEPWQEWYLAQIYSWKRKDNHIRRFKFVYLLTGKGNGKTVLDSIIMALDLLFNRGGEAVVVAARKEQSEIAFNNIKSFIRNSEILSSQLDFTTAQIFNRNKENTCRALSGRPEGINGKNLSVAVLDEIAEIRNFEVYNNTLSSCSKRAEALVVMSTTAQPNTESVGYEEWKKCIKILDGTIEDESYLPVLYQLDEGDDWTDSSLYKKANPNLDVSIMLEELERKLKNAKAGITSDEIQIRTLHLNQWVHDNSTTWISAERWSVSAGNYEEYKEYLTDEKLKNCLATVGVDLSLRNDLSVYTIAFWIPEIRKYYLKHHIYVPQEEIANKMKSDSYLFYQWIKEGWVDVIPGPIIKNEIIAADLVAEKKRYLKIKEVSYDKQFIDDDSEDLLNKNYKLLRFPQTTQYMSQPTSLFYNQVLMGSVIDPSPTMAWCISNAELERNNYGIKVRKEYASSSRRVDPVITSIMAIAQLQHFIQLEEKKKKTNLKDWEEFKY